MVEVGTFHGYSCIAVQLELEFLELHFRVGVAGVVASMVVVVEASWAVVLEVG